MRFLPLCLTVAAASLGCSTAIVIQDSDTAESATNVSSSSGATDSTGSTSIDSVSGSDTDSSASSQTGPSTDPSGTGYETTGTTTGVATSTGTDSDDTDSSGTGTGTDSDTDTTTGTGTDSDTSTGTDSDTGTGSSTGGDEACEELDAEACDLADECMGLYAKEVNLKDLCTISPATFQGCVEAAPCGDAITYACPDDVDPKTPYEFIDTCIPEDFTMCEVPPLKGDC